MKPYWSYSDRLKPHSWSGLHVPLYIQSRTVPHDLSRSCTIANSIFTRTLHPCQFFKSFKNHTRLSRIHSNGPSVTRIRPWLVWLYVRFTRMANRISRVFCVRQALYAYIYVLIRIVSALRFLFYYPPSLFVEGILFSCWPSVRVSAQNLLFFNILKSHYWNFIKM